MIRQCDKDLTDVPCFSKANLLGNQFCWRFLTCPTVRASVFNKHAGSRLVSKDLCTNRWKQSFKLSICPAVRISTRNVVSIKDIMPWFVRPADLYVRPWSGIIENLADEVLVWASFFDQYRQQIFIAQNKRRPMMLPVNNISFNEDRDKFDICRHERANR